MVGIDDLYTGHVVIERAFANVRINDGGPIQYGTELTNRNTKKSWPGTLYNKVTFLTHCHCRIMKLWVLAFIKRRASKVGRAARPTEE